MHPAPATRERNGLARGLARALVRLYYPRIEVSGAALIPRTGPVLLVANHPNSLIDPVLLGIAAERPVRLLAKAPLFNVPLFGSALRALGMVPAYRGSDDARQVSRNLESLAAAARALSQGVVLGIFPEGKSHDAAQLAAVRSGAARIALQAVALGLPALPVVPIGIHYERKERFRTAVWLRVGRPIDASAWLRQHAGDEHRAMRTLTQEIDARLRRCVVHLDDVHWEPLLATVEALLPPAPGGRRGALATLHRRKRAADAINHFQRQDPVRAAAAASRVAAHAGSLQARGLPLDSRIFQRRGWRLALSALRDALLFLPAGLFGLAGLLHHVLPYGLVRILAGRTARSGRMVVALSRLGLSLPIYAAWYAFVWYRLQLYFVPWVAWAWVASMPLAGLVALSLVRRLRVDLPYLAAELRLLARPQQAAELRREHDEIRGLLDGFASEAGMPASVAAPAAPGRVYRPPVWLAPALGGAMAGLLTLGVWLWRDRPIEVLRVDSPALHALAGAELDERMAADERALLAVISGLDELEQRFRRFEAALLAGERSYYRPEDDDEIRRMLLSYLSFRSALLRTVWYYQRHARLPEEHRRLRALLLHYTAAALAYDYTARFVLAFDGREQAMRKLNEAEPRWDLAAGTFDALRANLGHVAHRRWLEDGWRNYHATLPRWSERGLRDAEPYATFHRVVAVAGENTAPLAQQLLRYKWQTAWADVGKFARGGWYRASSAVSTLVGDARIRQPRGARGLITPERLAGVRERLRPGDIVIERRNWYLSNAFLPGFWPHAALYVGTTEDLRALGWDQDPRIAAHLNRFSATDASGHRFALIEAVSEGVIFSTVEHSIGEADAVAVLRPRLTPDQLREVVARAFSHAGKPYDFDFDFFSADRLVCTEVVFRAFGSYVDFPLVDILGRKTLPALEIVRHALGPTGAPQLEFVAFLDGDERTGTCEERDVEALRESLTRPALTWLQD